MLVGWHLAANKFISGARCPAWSILWLGTDTYAVLEHSTCVQPHNCPQIDRFSVCAWQGLSPEYDAAIARVEALQQALEEAVAAQQQQLAACGEPAAVTKKVRLVQQGEEMLLEVC